MIGRDWAMVSRKRRSAVFLPSIFFLAALVAWGNFDVATHVSPRPWGQASGRHYLRRFEGADDVYLGPLPFP